MVPVNLRWYDLLLCIGVSADIHPVAMGPGGGRMETMIVIAFSRIVVMMMHMVAGPFSGDSIHRICMVTLGPLPPPLGLVVPLTLSGLVHCSLINNWIGIHI